MILSTPPWTTLTAKIRVRPQTQTAVTGASHRLARSEMRSLVLLESRLLERLGFAITGGELLHASNNLPAAAYPMTVIHGIAPYI